MTTVPYDVVPYLIGAAIAGPLIRVLTRAIAARVAAAAFGVAAMAIPIAGTSLAVYAATLTGTLSVPSIALLAAAALGPIGRQSLVAARDAHALLLAALLVALLVFSGAYGATDIGLYRTGYEGLIPAAFAVAAIGAAWLTGRTGAAWVWVAALAIFHLGLLPSPNLWDHIADPFLAVAAALWLPLAMATAAVSRRRRIT